VRFAVANYSTASLDGYAMLYFSNDLVFDSSDYASPDYFAISPAAAHAGLFSYSFRVPDIIEVPGAFFWPIIKVVGTVDTNNDDVNTGDPIVVDWIPATGIVRTCDTV
jgi:hypothetical protein